MEEVQEVSLEWRGRGRDVMVAGEFSNWVGLSMVRQDDELWSIKLKLKHGQYMCKFVVDGEWNISDEMDTVTDTAGNTNNMVIVEQKGSPWNNVFKDTSERIPKHIDDLLECDAYMASAPTFEFTAPSLESEVDKVTNYLNEINQNKEEISEITLKWKGQGREVLVAGDFSNWDGLSMTNEEKDLWKITLKVKNGQHLLNYIVDGETVISDYMEKTSGPNNAIFNLLNVSPEHVHIGNENDVFTEDVLGDDYDDEVRDVTITWDGPAKDVMVSGDFSNWVGLTMAHIDENTWRMNLKLQHGQYFLMFFVDGEVVLSDSLEQVTGEDEELYNLLVVESDKVPTYKKYSTYDNIADCVTKPIHDEVVEKPDSLDLKIGDKIMHGKEFSHSVTVTENSTGKKLDEESIADAWEPFIGNSGVLNVLDDHKNEVSHTELMWKGQANDVKVSGVFSNWVGLTMTNFGRDLWKISLKLKPGNYDLNFIINENINKFEDEEKINQFEDDEKFNQFEDRDDVENREYQTENTKDDFNDLDKFGVEAETCENTIIWTGHASDVKVIGEFSEWTALSMAKENENTWAVTLKQKKGSYLAKFIVDGKYMLTENLQKVIGPDQEVYNIIEVNPNENEQDDEYETDSETGSVTITDDGKLVEQNIFNPFEDNLADNLKDAGYNAFVADINIHDELSIIYEEDRDSSIKMENEDMKFVNFEIPGDLIRTEDNVKKDTIGEEIDAEDASELSGNINLAANNIFDASNAMKTATNEKQIDINNDIQVAQQAMNDDLLFPYKLSQEHSTANDEVVETSISWKGFADDVKVVGPFSNWEGLTMSNLREDTWSINLKLKFGQHLLKFIVDGKYVLSKYIEKVIGPDEEIYNVVEVTHDDRKPADYDNSYIVMEDVDTTFSNKIMDHNQKISLNPFNDSFTDSLKDSGYEHSFEDQKEELSSDEEPFTENMVDKMQSPGIPVFSKQASEEQPFQIDRNYDNMSIKEAVASPETIITTNVVFERNNDIDNFGEPTGTKKELIDEQLVDDDSMDAYGESCFNKASEAMIKDEKYEVVETSLYWNGFADDVKIVGEFSNWEVLTMSNEKEDIWTLRLKLKNGQYLLQFIVNGSYKLSEHLEKAIGPNEEVYNVLKVSSCIMQPDNKQTREFEANTLTDGLKDSGYDNSFEDIKYETSSYADDNYDLSESEVSDFTSPIITQEGSKIETFDSNLYIKEAIEISGSILRATDTVIDRKDGVTSSQYVEPTKIQMEEENTIPMIRQQEQLNVFLGCQAQSVEKKETSCDLKTMESILNRTENEVVETSIQWFGFAKDVKVLGEFSNWEALTMSNEKEDKWTLTIKQKTGQFLLKFIVDGKYMLSEDLEKVIGSDQEVYNLLDVFPQSDNYQLSSGGQTDKLNIKSVNEEEGKQCNATHDITDDPLLEKLTMSDKTEVKQSSNQTMEMDAVETLEKTLGVTNYVIQSKAEQMIPLIRSEDEQLTVFLASNTQPLIAEQDIEVAGQEEEIKRENNVEGLNYQLIPLIRNPDDQLSVFLATDMKPLIPEQEPEVSGMSLAPKQKTEVIGQKDKNIPLIRNPDDQLGVFLGNSKYSQHVVEQSIPIQKSYDQHTILHGNEVFEKEESITVNSEANSVISGNKHEYVMKEKLIKEKMIEEDIIEAEEIILNSNIIENDGNEEEMVENEQIETARNEKERIKNEKSEEERVEKERVEKERIEKERIEKDRIEKEMIEKERTEQAVENERIEKESIQKERIERERIEKERIEKEKIEEERIEKERIVQERIEQERIEQERIEQERIEQERIEQERIEQERIEQERIEQERIGKERIEKERIEHERIEQERIEQERIEQDRIEQERIEQERIEQERIEQEKMEQEKMEKERIETERLENERLEQERFEKEQIEKERVEQERIEKVKAEKERIEKERIEKERIEEERIEKERIEQERNEQERIEQERIEQERIEQERIEQERIEQERIKQERIEQERLEQQKIEQERIDHARMEQERIEQERKEQEKIEQERIEQDRIEQEKIKQKKIEQDKIEQERIEQERIEQDRIERERLEQERIEQERIEQERMNQERIEQERIENEKAEQERLDQERLEQERLEQERIEQERIEQVRIKKEKAEKEQIEKEKAEQERIEQEKAEKERIEKEKAEQERLEQERIEQERIEQERLEQERLEQERLEQERIEQERLEQERIEQERVEKERRAEKERLDQERLAEQKKRIELEIIAEEERMENARRALDEQKRLQEAKLEDEMKKIAEKEKVEETHKLEQEAKLTKQAEERAIVEDIRIQMLIDKNNKLLLEEQEREEKEKARLTRESEERAQVEEQIRKEEEKLDRLRIEKENEEQNRKKEQDMKRINNFIENNNKSKSLAEKQMAADDPGKENGIKGPEHEKKAEINAAFVANEISQTIEVATPKNVVNGHGKAEQTNGKGENGNIDDQNATKVAIEQAKNAAEATVANIEEILMKKEDTKEVSHGTFVALEVESGESSMDCRKKNPVMRKMLKLCQCNIL